MEALSSLNWNVTWKLFTALLGDGYSRYDGKSCTTVNSGIVMLITENKIQIAINKNTCYRVCKSTLKEHISNDCFNHIMYVAPSIYNGTLSIYIDLKKYHVQEQKSCFIS